MATMVICSTSASDSVSSLKPFSKTLLDIFGRGGGAVMTSIHIAMHMSSSTICRMSATFQPLFQYADAKPFLVAG